MRDLFLLNQMGEQGLRDHIEALSIREEYVGQWEQVAKHAATLPLKRELHARIEGIRNAYMQIPLNAPHALAVLAAYQGAESELRSLLQNIESADAAHKEIDEEMANALQVLKSKERERESAGNTIVSPEAIRRMPNG